MWGVGGDLEFQCHMESFWTNKVQDRVKIPLLDRRIQKLIKVIKIIYK